MVLSRAVERSLRLARLGLLSGFGILLLFNILVISYTVLLIATSGDPEQFKHVFVPIQWMVLTLDLAAGGLLAIGFWTFGIHHDTIRNQAQNMAIAFAIWFGITLTWRLRLLWTPLEEINPISRLFEEGEYGVFVPHFEFLRVNYVGFLLSSILMFILMVLLVRLIRNYRVYENFQDVNLNRFQMYGLTTMVSAVLLGLGWLAFGPSMTGTPMGQVMLIIYIVAWLSLFLVLPIMGLWVFFPAFIIHRSAVETLKFILRRKSERERAEVTTEIEVARG
jgi:ABC-type multidrug transport system permease subunit